MEYNAIYKEFSEETHCYHYIIRKVEDFPLQDHDVLIDVHACSLSSDCAPETLTELFLKRPKFRLSAASCVSGVVVGAGSQVTRCSLGDRVAGILPLDSDSSGCASRCISCEFEIVVLPDGVDDESAACCIGDGVRAYIALQYLGRVSVGDTVMVMDAGTAFGSLVVQLAHAWGAKVLAVITGDEDRTHLQKLQPPPEHVLEIASKSAMTSLHSSVMEETGRLGVDLFIDNGVRQYAGEDEPSSSLDLHALPVKHDIISCLAIGARWVTSHPLLQLDPPNSLQLYLRGASICFLFEQSWNLSAARQGKWLHMMQHVVRRLEDGSLKAHISQTVPFNIALGVLNSLDRYSCGKTIVRMVSDSKDQATV